MASVADHDSEGDRKATARPLEAGAGVPRGENESLDAFVHRVLHVDREQDGERDAAADEGTAIHDALESALKGEIYEPRFHPYVEALKQLTIPLGRCVFTEKILVGQGYAGRTDAGFEDNCSITVCDFKSCKALPMRGAWDEHRMQIAAYCAALGNTGDKLVRGVVIYIDRNIPGNIVAHEVIDWRDEFKAFKCLLDYWYCANRMEFPR
jgi:hypothetical protein